MKILQVSWFHNFCQQLMFLRDKTDSVQNCNSKILILLIKFSFFIHLERIWKIKKKKKKEKRHI